MQFNLFKKKQNIIKFNITINDVKHKVPLGWEEITLLQFQRIAKIQTDDELTYLKLALCELLDIEIELFNSIQFNQVEALKELLSYLKTQPSIDANQIINIDGVELGLIPDFNLMSFGEWIDLNNYIKDTDNLTDNLHKILAILYRPIIKTKGKKYELEKYTIDNIEERREMIQNNSKINEVYGAVVFFCLFTARQLKTT